MSDQQKAEFQPIEGAESIRLITEGANTLSSTIMWIKEQDDQLSTHLHRVSQVEEAFFCWLPKEFDQEKFKKHLAERKSSECLFSVSLPTANIFFRAYFIDFEENSMKFQLPEKVFKVQRRQNQRFQIPEGYLLKVQFADPLKLGQKLTRKIYDLSASGVAFIIESGDEPIYLKDLILYEFTFTVKTRTITVEAEVKHVSHLPESSKIRGSKVGVQFRNIKAADAQHLALYVFDESRRYFSKFF